SIFSRDLGSSSQRQSAIYEDAPTSEGASQRSPGGGHEEGEPVVVSVSLPVGLDEFSQAPRQPMGEIQVGQTAALGTPKQPEDGLDRGRAAAAAAARATGRPASSPRRRREPSNSCPWSCTTARASVIEGVRFRSKLYHSGLLVGAMIEKSRVPDSGRQRRAGEEVAGYCSLRTPSI
ncbi:unnamed protein product, partial [Prorocentrum cordatum]